MLFILYKMLRIKNIIQKFNDISPPISIRRNYASKRNAKVFGPQYCVNLVQQYDYENFLCTLLLTGDRRRSAFAVRALNVEVSRIASVVTEDLTGRMRLQFWKDSMDEIYDLKKAYVLDHPVLNELRQVLVKHKLNKTYLKRLVNSRDRPSNKTFLTVKELEDYAEQSVSSVYYLLLEICDKKDMNIDHAISHLGKAQGITNLLRAIPRQSRNLPVNIPQEVLMKHGVSQERILRDKFDDKGVEECVFEIATVAHQHLQKARSLSKHISRDIMPLFLPAVAVQRYLDRLREEHFRLSEDRLQQRDTLLPLAYYWYRIKGAF